MDCFPERSASLLPGLHGLGLVKTLRGAAVATPVRFVTTLGGIVDRVQDLEAGGDDAIRLPQGGPRRYDIGAIIRFDASASMPREPTRRHPGKTCAILVSHWRLRALPS
jgi:hypothetical protein